MKLINSPDNIENPYMYYFAFNSVTEVLEHLKFIDEFAMNNLKCFKRLKLALNLPDKDEILLSCINIMELLRKEIIGNNPEAEDMTRGVLKQIFSLTKKYLDNQKSHYSELYFGAILYTLNTIISPGYDIFSKIEASQKK
ncbi:MAG: hypothetical protein MHMPM18_002365, partial [Marteilia pararefringens]